jgi:hypothetical protein
MLSACFFGGHQPRPELPVNPAARPQPPPSNPSRERQTLPPSTQEDRDRDVGRFPNPPLGPADTVSPNPDPEALKEALRQRARTSSAAQESAIVVGIVVVRPRRASAIEGSATISDELGGTRIVLDLANTPAATYQIEMSRDPLSCVEASLADKPVANGLAMNLGTVTVPKAGSARFVAVLPRVAQGNTVYDYEGRAVSVRATDKAGAVLACGEIALSKSTPFGGRADPASMQEERLAVAHLPHDARDVSIALVLCDVR